MRSPHAMLLETVRASLIARGERRYARLASMELLDLYWRQRLERPDVEAHELYESIVAQRLGPRANRAAELVRQAGERFTANWPAMRELKFRHVVHYLIFDEYLRRGWARRGTKINIGVAVIRVVPKEI